jgi:predicted transcriptional regulator
MGVSQAESYVLRLLRGRGPMTTMQIEVLARDQHRKCPDQTVIFLTKMRKKGLIKGEASLERRGWLWWAP